MKRGGAGAAPRQIQRVSEMSAQVRGGNDNRMTEHGDRKTNVDANEGSREAVHRVLGGSDVDKAGCGIARRDRNSFARQSSEMSSFFSEASDFDCSTRGRTDSRVFADAMNKTETPLRPPRKQAPALRNTSGIRAPAVPPNPPTFESSFRADAPGVLPKTQSFVGGSNRGSNASLDFRSGLESCGVDLAAIGRDAKEAASRPSDAKQSGQSE